MKSFKPLLIAILVSLPFNLFSQVSIKLSLGEFLDMVKERNIEYAAQQLNVNIAEAGIEAAKVFNDPSLSVAYNSANIYGMKMGDGVGVELSKTISFGKRGSAIDVAKGLRDVEQIMLKDYFSRLRSEAALQWVEVIKFQRLHDVMLSTYDMVLKLVEQDSLRFEKGKINELDLRQSKVEAGIMANELLDSEVELQHSYMKLAAFCGIAGNDTVIVPGSSVIMHARDFDLNNLIKVSKEQRYDLKAAEMGIDISQLEIAQAKIERRSDIDVAVGLNVLGKALNSEAPSPAHRDVYVGVSIPLPFSKLKYKGEVKAAQYKAKQAELRYYDKEISVKNEIIDSYNMYKRMDRQHKSYSGGLLLQAKYVLDAKKSGYKSGETPFLELLDAQRTYDSIMISYFETLYSKTEALIKLESAAGIWDIK